MRLIVLVTLVLFLSTLTGCTGDTTSENIEDTNSEIESDNERVVVTTLIGKEECEGRGGTWFEESNRSGESHCSLDEEPTYDPDSPKIYCEQRGGTWDEEIRDCSFPEQNSEGEELQEGPTYVPPCNVTASMGLNSTNNPIEWSEFQSGTWLSVDGLTAVSYTADDYDNETEIVVDQRLDWMCGYTYSVKIPPAYNSSYSYPVFAFLHGDIYDLNFYNNFLTNNFHMPEDDKYIIVRPSKLELDWDPKKVLDVIEDVKSNLNVDDDRVYLTGYSMGGRGTFIVAAALPEYFAAIMPLQPHHEPYSYLTLAEDVAHLPVWMSHGTNDSTSSYDMAAKMAENLSNLGSEIEFQTVVGGEHGGYLVIYNNPEIMQWILSHVRGQ